MTWYNVMNDMTTITTLARIQTHARTYTRSSFVLWMDKWYRLYTNIAYSITFISSIESWTGYVSPIDNTIYLKHISFHEHTYTVTYHLIIHVLS